MLSLLKIMYIYGCMIINISIHYTSSLKVGDEMVLKVQRKEEKSNG